MGDKYDGFSKTENLLRLLSCFTQAIEVYAFGGLVFGLNTLVYILKKERIWIMKFSYIRGIQ